MGWFNWIFASQTALWLNDTYWCCGRGFGLWQENMYPRQQLYHIHLFSCTLTQIVNHPMTWQQLDAFIHTKKMTHLSSKWSLEWQRKRFESTLKVVVSFLVPDGLVGLFQRVEFLSKIIHWGCEHIHMYNMMTGVRKWTHWFGFLMVKAML